MYTANLYHDTPPICIATCAEVLGSGVVGTLLISISIILFLVSLNVCIFVGIASIESNHSAGQIITRLTTIYLEVGVQFPGPLI